MADWSLAAMATNPTPVDSWNQVRATNAAIRAQMAETMPKEAANRQWIESNRAISQNMGPAEQLLHNNRITPQEYTQLTGKPAPQAAGAVPNPQAPPMYQIPDYSYTPLTREEPKYSWQNATGLKEEPMSPPSWWDQPQDPFADIFKNYVFINKRQ